MRERLTLALKVVVLFRLERKDFSTVLSGALSLSTEGLFFIILERSLTLRAFTLFAWLAVFSLAFSSRISLSSIVLSFLYLLLSFSTIFLSDSKPSLNSEVSLMASRVL
eukprot:TRINITY_DN1340_c0_g7_i1.p2 TRINITY_DN1340_c0_g7~~TRINITY_DN1340_c0_g7_i1.p2  ORF type:complete len:109 (+),score=16.77 TRINITY_DN1340_c0_g7_i1:87-413(+)